MKIFLVITVVLCSLFAVVDSSSAQTWAQIGAPTQSWYSVVSSADGSKLAAVTPGGSLYTSADFGITWISNNVPSLSERYANQPVAVSADGSKLVAVASAGGIYISTNFGAIWSTNIAPSQNFWTSAASSANGNKLIVAAINGPVFISTNSGALWTQANLPMGGWGVAASSADGNTLLLAPSEVNDGVVPIYLSTNAGDTWIPQTNLPSHVWGSAAVSADGGVLTIFLNNRTAIETEFFQSTNSGALWTEITPQQGLNVFCASADGSKLATVNESSIFYSSDFGNSWISNSIPNPYNNQGWQCAASSADGNRLVFGGSSGIYSCNFTPAPQLNLAASNASLAFSWLVPSTNFVLQQNLDLTKTNWMTLTNTPVLNLTNLNNELSISPSNSSGFFRLISQ